MYYSPVVLLVFKSSRVVVTGFNSAFSVMCLCVSLQIRICHVSFSLIPLSYACAKTFDLYVAYLFPSCIRFPTADDFVSVPPFSPGVAPSSGARDYTDIVGNLY